MIWEAAVATLPSKQENGDRRVISNSMSFLINSTFSSITFFNSSSNQYVKYNSMYIATDSSIYTGKKIKYNAMVFKTANTPWRLLLSRVLKIM